MRAGLILFAHGARDPRWAAPFEAIAARVREQRPDVALRLAYLELMSPDLATAASDLAAEGCRHIDVLPLFLGTGGHLRRDLPPMIEAIAAHHPGLSVRLHGAAGEAADVIDALAAHAIAIAIANP
jgi:sirohydrochlorin cobaltochelatase